MTFTDILTSSSKSFRCASVSDGLNKLGQHRRFKQLNASLLNLFSRHRPANHQHKFDNSGHSSTHPSLLHPLSDSSRSVTFASVFEDIEYDSERPALAHANSEENDDLVIVVADKHVSEENDAHVEAYPFRSEIPLCSFPKSTLSTSTGDAYHSKRKFLPFRRPKKLHRPLETPPINRSRSEPTISSSSSSDFAAVTHNHSRQVGKQSRRRFQLPSFARLLQTFIKHPNGSRKRNVPPKSATLRKYSEMIY